MHKNTLTKIQTGKDLNNAPAESHSIFDDLIIIIKGRVGPGGGDFACHGKSKKSQHIGCERTRLTPVVKVQFIEILVQTLSSVSFSSVSFRADHIKRITYTRN